MTLHFAGPVVAATSGAEVDGHTARVRDATKIDAEGLGITARTVAIPPVGTVPAGLGLALGALLLSAIVIVPEALRRRTARTTSQSGFEASSGRDSRAGWDSGAGGGSDPDPERPSRVEVAPPTPRVRETSSPEDPSVWAPDST